ncbi:type II secretion system F family protein [Isachenkonia alkalipeptolytica]|uniref:Type II secretion system F family protein n=1 Tax=Isachenkonia alkalipeptolytica TaxID=2565777 RepID=A0AA43XL24_9CLOT|nr:type II secretion system F family protein [Isachenkonia alkalipeptolytica]NBG88795.1 type II secretion system F family protein [Isachenkonia alkalipeptolytica]
MEIYKYTILKNSGEILQGEIQGYNRKDAISRLLNDDHTILKIRRKYLNLVDKPLYESYTKRIKLLILMVNQLKVMTSSGLSIMESIKSMEEHTDDRTMKKILKNIYSNLYYGNSMKDSLDPKVFPDFFIHIIGVGETSGNLEEALHSLSLYYTRDLTFYHKLKNMLIYPTILLFFSFIMLLVTTNFLIPNFIVFLEDGVNSLPWYSRVVFSLSSFIQRLWPIILSLLLIFVFIFYNKSRWFLKHKIFSLLLLKTPIISKLLIKRTLLKFIKNLEVILLSGSNLTYALKFLQEQNNNPMFQKALNSIQADISKGHKFSEALNNEETYFSSLIVNMVAAGEKSGDLVFVLGKISEYLQEDLDQKTKRFIALLEPGLIVFMAVFVGLILVSVMVPIFSSYEFML